MLYIAYNWISTNCQDSALKTVALLDDSGLYCGRFTIRNIFKKYNDTNVLLYTNYNFEKNNGSSLF